MYLLPVDSGLWEGVLLVLSLFSCHGERIAFKFDILLTSFYLMTSTLKFKRVRKIFI